MQRPDQNSRRALPGKEARLWRRISRVLDDIVGHRSLERESAPATRHGRRIFSTKGCPFRSSRVQGVWKKQCFCASPCLTISLMTRSEEVGSLASATTEAIPAKLLPLTLHEHASNFFVGRNTGLTENYPEYISLCSLSFRDGGRVVVSLISFFLSSCARVISNSSPLTKVTRLFAASLGTCSPTSALSPQCLSTQDH